MLEESIGEAYTKLVMPLPVGESQKSMERQREQYANEELKAPVAILKVSDRELMNRTRGRTCGHRLPG